MFDYEVGVSTYLDVYFIGIVNTFLSEFWAFLFILFWAFTIGIRLSSNLVVFRSFATIYIELLRNIPLLLQLFFLVFRGLARNAESVKSWNLLRALLG